MRVAIVGAGICGLYLARKLAERGEEVTVFEKRDKIGKEVCSGLFSDRILEFFPESRDLVQNRINYCLIHFPSFRNTETKGKKKLDFLRPPKKTLKLEFSRKFLVMSHYDLDNLAASLAEKAGVEILLKSDFYEHPRRSDFERIIGCDGALSNTRRKLGLKDPEFYSGIQGFIKGVRPRSDPVETVETWPTENGFIWRIPRGNEIEWGIMEKPPAAQIIFNDFLVKNNVRLEKQRAWLIPQGLRMVVDSRIALCGDAAGLCKPWSGGGVIWGLTAGDILLKNFPDFVKYTKAVGKFFGPKIILSKMAKKIIYFSGKNLAFFLRAGYKIEGDFLI